MVSNIIWFVQKRSTCSLSMDRTTERAHLELIDAVRCNLSIFLFLFSQLVRLCSRSPMAWEIATVIWQSERYEVFWFYGVAQTFFPQTPFLFQLLQPYLTSFRAGFSDNAPKLSTTLWLVNIDGFNSLYVCHFEFSRAVLYLLHKNIRAIV